MVIGVGTDILSLERIHDILKAGNEHFVNRIFTEKERAQSAESSDPLSYFATRFAGKEAVFKCFGISGNIKLSEIEILDGETGQPYVTLLGAFSDIAKQRRVRDVLVSLSYENEYAIAFAVAQT
jgi:holo-[acyl-carrier protein] synthase